MAKLKVGVIELITNGENHSLYGRVAHANFASIMPQVIASWCDQRGHEVEYTVFTGFEDLEKIIPDDRDIVFIGAFTHAALLAYALSNLLRSKGIVTVLGGPHARCYPDDAIMYFDYVAGFTNEEIAQQLHVSGRTVLFHIHNTYEKLNFVSYREMITWAVQSGLHKNVELQCNH